MRLIIALTALSLLATSIPAHARTCTTTCSGGENGIGQRTCTTYCY